MAGLVGTGTVFGFVVAADVGYEFSVSCLRGVAADPGGR